MKNDKNILNFSILILAISLLLFIVLQGNVKMFEEQKLDGDIELSEDIEFSFENWFSGDYALTKEEYLNENFGFRNFCVRLKNQLYFSIFGKVFANQVVMGKEGFLYEMKYLKAHAGLDYLGDNEIKERTRKLKFIQDSLAHRGINFAVLFAPGKATYYPEYIPEPYNFSGEKTNYKEFTKEVAKVGVNFYDFNRMFLESKQDTKYPLYPKTGTHWSEYGIQLAFDSLLNYMTKLSGRSLSKITYNEIEMSYVLRGTDGDIAEGLNLLKPPPHFEMAYPNTKFLPAEDNYKPKVIAVGDSYWMGFYLDEFTQKAFTDHEFWYYNKKLFNHQQKTKLDDVHDLNLKERIESSEFVFILSTEATLNDIGWGFIDEVYDLYKFGAEAYQNSKGQKKVDSEVNRIVNDIKNTPKWLAKIKEEAKKTNTNLDSSILKNATYIYNLRQKEKQESKKGVKQKGEYSFAKEALELGVSEDSLHKEHEIELLKIENNIKGTPPWLAKVKKDAKSKNISLEECLRQHAKFMLMKGKKEKWKQSH